MGMEPGGYAGRLVVILGSLRVSECGYQSGGNANVRL